MNQTKTFAEFLKNYRKRRGMTQRQFADRLGADYQSISKLETGRIKSPSPRFLESLAAETGLSLDEVLAMSADQPSASKKISERRGVRFKLRLVFGHCLWGAPIFLAAHRGMLPDFETASFAPLEATNDYSNQNLAWIEPDKFSQSYPGPRVRDVEPWSAVKILDALEKETIDVGAVPGNILWGRGRFQRFLRVGTVVDSATGCVFVCDANELQPDDSVLSTSHLFSLIRKHAADKKGEDVRIAVEVGTVSEDYLRSAFALQKSAGNAPMSIDPAALRADRISWHCESSTLARFSFEELKEQCRQEQNAELLGIITWEPHASWLQMLETSGTSLLKVPLYFSPDQAGRMKHMSFDLVMLRTATLDDEKRAALLRLFQKTWQNAVLLSEMDGSSFDADPLTRIGVYFGFMDKSNAARTSSALLDKVRAAVQSIRYSVHLAMESQLLTNAHALG